MSDILIRNSRSKSVYYALGALFVCGLGIWVIRSGNEVWYGWAFAILGGLAALGFTFMYFDRDPQIVISDEGLAIPDRGIELIEWRDVDTVYTESTRGYEYLTIALNDPAGFIERRPADKGWVIDGEIAIRADSFEMSCDDIADAETIRASGHDAGGECVSTSAFPMNEHEHELRGLGFS